MTRITRTDLNSPRTENREDGGVSVRRFREKHPRHTEGSIRASAIIEPNCLLERNCLPANLAIRSLPADVNINYIPRRFASSALTRRSVSAE
jgi:hypothetical protein